MWICVHSSFDENEIRIVNLNRYKCYKCIDAYIVVIAYWSYNLFKVTLTVIVNILLHENDRQQRQI